VTRRYNVLHTGSRQGRFPSIAQMVEGQTVGVLSAAAEICWPPVTGTFCIRSTVEVLVNIFWYPFFGPHFPMSSIIGGEDNWLSPNRPGFESRRGR
jgi:hypothetical protein